MMYEMYVYDNSPQYADARNPSVQVLKLELSIKEEDALDAIKKLLRSLKELYPSSYYELKLFETIRGSREIEIEDGREIEE